MLLNLNKPIMDLSKKPIIDEQGHPIMMGKLVAQFIAGTSELEALKFMPIAQNLFDHGTVEIDLIDLKKLEEFIEKNKSFSTIAKAPILEEINKSKVEGIKK